MADAYAVNYADLLPGGFASWKVIPRDRTGPIDLGVLFDGRMVVKSIDQRSSKGRMHPFAADVEISAKMLSTHKGTVLELLGYLVGPAQHEILGVNGEFYAATGTNLLGLGWRFDSSSDFDGSRYVEVMAKGKVILNGTDFDLDNFFAAATGIGVVGPEGTLATWSAAGYNPAGVTGFTITGQSTLGAFRNAKLIASTKEIVDSHGRNVPFMVNVQVEAELMQTENTELQLINEQFSVATGYVVTLADGAVFTFTNTQTGMSFEFHNDTDSDGISFVRVMGSGDFLLSEFAGLVA